MGKSERRKGINAERELVHLLEDLGVKSHRVPLSGAMKDYKDDIVLEDESTIEVKRRKKISTFFYDLLKTADYGIIREDTNRTVPVIDKWLVVMSLKKFAELFNKSKIKITETTLEKEGINQEAFDKWLKTVFEDNKNTDMAKIKIVFQTPFDGKEHTEIFMIKRGGAVIVPSDVKIKSMGEVKNDD